MAAVAEGVRARGQSRVASRVPARGAVGRADGGDVGQVHGLAVVELDHERRALAGGLLLNFPALSARVLLRVGNGSLLSEAPVAGAVRLAETL